MENTPAFPRMHALRTRIKFCGLTRVEDVQHAVALGVDAIGFVFHPMSPRAVSIHLAAELAKEIPPFISIVGVFVDAQPSAVQEICEAVPLSLLQLHGDETPVQCKAIGNATGLPWLRVMRMAREALPRAAPAQTPPPSDKSIQTSIFSVAGGMTDAEKEALAIHKEHHPESLKSQQPSKTGKGPDAVRATIRAYEGARGFLLDTFTSGHGGSGKTFDWSRIPEECASRIILSGGLNTDNIHKAITQIRPYAVDISSGIEAIAPGHKDPARMAAFVQAVRAADAAVGI